MKVKFNNTQVSNKTILNFASLEKLPIIEIEFNETIESDLYTLLFYNETKVYYLVVNIPGSDISRGNLAVSYKKVTLEDFKDDKPIIYNIGLFRQDETIEDVPEIVTYMDILENINFTAIVAISFIVDYVDFSDKDVEYCECLDEVKEKQRLECENKGKCKPERDEFTICTEKVGHQSQYCGRWRK